MSKNLEIKAKCNHLDKIREILLKMNADYKGLDHQIDTYFNVKNGRLKLREGSIENNLIQYKRPDQSGPKQSDFKLFKTEKGSDLKPMLKMALGIKAVVDKQREIYFIENVKFHLDRVKDLGTFIEIEATDLNNERTSDFLLKQCSHYLEIFGVNTDDLLEKSYSDMILSDKKC